MLDIVGLPSSMLNYPYMYIAGARTYRQNKFGGMDFGVPLNSGVFLCIVGVLTEKESFLWVEPGRPPKYTHDREAGS